MKKISIILLLLTCLIGYSAATQAGPVISIKIELGKRSCDCCGFGVCSITGSIEIFKLKDPMAGDNAAYGSITMNGGKLKLSVFKKSIDEKTLNKFFSNGYFIVDEEFELTEDLCAKLGIKKMMIPAGKYPIQKTTDYFQILF